MSSKLAHEAHAQHEVVEGLQLEDNSLMTAPGFEGCCRMVTSFAVKAVEENDKYPFIARPVKRRLENSNIFDETFYYEKKLLQGGVSRGRGLDTNRSMTSRNSLGSCRKARTKSKGWVSPGWLPLRPITSEAWCRGTKLCNRSPSISTRRERWRVSPSSVR